MNLIKKHLIYFFTVITIVLVLIISIFMYAIYPNYEVYEESFAQKEAEYLKKLINYQIERFQLTVNDWAFWDDTYKFVGDKNRDYIDSNIAPETYSELSIDYLVIFNRYMDSIFSGGADRLSQKELFVPQELFDHFKENVYSGVNSSKNGFLNVNGDALLFASQRISNTDKTGESNGYILMAKWFSDQSLQDLVKLSKRKIQILPYESAIYELKDSQKLEDDIFFLKGVSNSYRTVFLVIKDVFNTNSWVLEIKFPSGLFLQMNSAVMFFLISLVITGCVTVLSLIWFLRREVVSRLKEMILQANSISVNKSFDQRLEIEKNDEISELAYSFNSMLDSLKDYQKFLRNIIDLIPHKVYAKDIEGKYYMLNEETAKMMKVSVEGAIGKTISELNRNLPVDFVEKVLHEDEQIIEKNIKLINIEESYIDNNNNYVYQQTSKVPIAEPFTGKELSLGVSIDITDLKKQQRIIEKQKKELEFSFIKLRDTNSRIIESEKELLKMNQELRKSESRLELALWGSQEQIWDWNLKSNMVTILYPNENPEDSRISNSKNCHWKDIVHPDDYNTLMKEFSEYIEKSINNHFESEFRIHYGSKEWIWCLCRGRITEKDRNGEPIRLIGTNKDITSRKDTEKELFNLAHYDTLTGLPNRYSFLENMNRIINQHMKSNLKFALFFLDLDGFKNINDSLGHLKGDIILKEVSERLRNVLKSSDIISRLGGDEFTVIAENLNSEFHAAKIAKRILKCFNKPFIIDNKELYLSTSIGVSIFPVDGIDRETLLKNADVAMYSVKTDGKNDFEFYSPTMNIHLHERIDLETDLRKAIEKKELLIYYQPQIDISNNRLVGLEALIRWNHTKHGFIPPSKFIPIAEETNMIISLGNWIFAEVIDRMTKWHENDFFPGRVSVNLSAKQFNDISLIEKLGKIIMNSPVKADSITLEITESVLMNSGDELVNKLMKIKESGFHLAIDDFGTGYSSLSYLRRFPINALKIDRSFINDIQNGKDSEVIIKAIIDLAKNLNLVTIAEGVETEEQLRFLSNNGCSIVQGFYYSKALPADEIIDFLVNRGIKF